MLGTALTDGALVFCPAGSEMDFVVSDGAANETIWVPEDEFLVMATKKGVVKKTNLAAYRNVRKDGIIAIKIEEGNELIDGPHVYLEDPGDEAVVHGNLIRNVNDHAIGLYGLSTMTITGNTIDGAAEGIEIGWVRWAVAASLPGLVSLLVVPLVLYRVYPPRLKETPDATALARRRLAALGPMTFADLEREGRHESLRAVDAS